MKIFNNKKYNTITLYVLLIIAISILMVASLFKFSKILFVFSKIVSVLMPIIWGLVIAYLLNPVMKFIEKLISKIICKKKPHKKACRTISVFLTMSLLFILLASLLYVIVPEITLSIQSIFKKIQNNDIENIQNWINDILDDNPTLNKFIQSEFETISESVQNLVLRLQPSFETFISNFTVGIFNFLLALKDFILGIIVSIYLLMSKETLLAQAKKIMLALFKKKTCEHYFSLYHKSNGMFIGFINGKIIDSFIIGILCFIGMSFLKMPYIVLISVIIGITNIIPFFGPFIGAIPSAFLVLLAEPNKLLAFLIFILILQQFDGNILGPKILGDSTGLPAFWVLFSIFLGGGLFGFIGMLIGIPTFAIIYGLFKTYIESKLEKNNLPIETGAYLGNVDALYNIKRAKDLEEDNINFEDYLQDKKQ